MNDSGKEKQLSFYAGPEARRSNPRTSQAAADAAARTASATSAAIHEALAARPSTTDEVAELLGLHPPTVGTRISALAKRGLVVPIGERLSARGRPASVWQAVDDPSRDAGPAYAPSARRLPRELKARDLLADGRVRLVRVNDREIRATVRGDHGTYNVSCDDRGWWTCSCPAGATRCSHAQAVRLVVGLGAR